MRCSGCNRLLGEGELMMTRVVDSIVVHEDLCYVCRSSAHSQYNYEADHLYTLHNLGIYGDFHKILNKD